MQEHVDNNFRPLPDSFRDRFNPLCKQIIEVFNDSIAAIDNDDPEAIDRIPPPLRPDKG